MTCNQSVNQSVRKSTPREIADGVHWLGDCLEQFANGKIYHTYNAAYLVTGDDHSLLVETGHPKDYSLLAGQLEKTLAGKPPLKYLFVTHQETPHSGGLGRILEDFDDVILCGDMSDYHLAFPQFADRMMPLADGDSVDLGNRIFRVVDPVIRDLRTTWWGFDEKERVLFPGDGFAYSHYHEDGHCGLFAEEAVSLDIPEVSAVFADLALFWTKFTEMEVYTERLEAMLKELDVRVIGPAHGLPVLDPATTFPKIKAGLLHGSAVPEGGAAQVSASST